MRQVISPAQALLIVIESAPEGLFRDSLMRLYLLGVRTPEDRKILQRVFNTPLLQDYHIPSTANIISNDVTRRYFETHLAWWSLSYGLGQIDESVLRAHVTALERLVPAEVPRHYLSPAVSTDPESAELWKQIKARKFPPVRAGFSWDYTKIELLATCIYLASVNAAIYGDCLPLPIYGTGFYAEKNRGRKDRPEGGSTKSQNLGLLTSVMPVPRDDLVFSEDIIGFHKASEIRTFVEGCAWTNYHFSQLVHPFSNSISGVMLMQLRCLAAIQATMPYQSPLLLSADRLGIYVKLFSALMLMHSGGHSWLEYITPIELPEVKMLFSRVMTGFHRVDMESVLYSSNEDALRCAIEETIVFNRRILARELVHDELMSKVISVDTMHEVATTLFEVTKNLGRQYRQWYGQRNTMHMAIPPSQFFGQRDVISELGRAMQFAPNESALFQRLIHFFKNPGLSIEEMEYFFCFLMEQLISDKQSYLVRMCFCHPKSLSLTRDEVILKLERLRDIATDEMNSHPGESPGLSHLNN